MPATWHYTLRQETVHVNTDFHTILPAELIRVVMSVTCLLLVRILAMAYIVHVLEVTALWQYGNLCIIGIFLKCAAHYWNLQHLNHRCRPTDDLLAVMCIMSITKSLQIRLNKSCFDTFSPGQDLFVISVILLPLVILLIFSWILLNEKGTVLKCFTKVVHLWWWEWNNFYNTHKLHFSSTCNQTLQSLRKHWVS